MGGPDLNLTKLPNELLDIVLSNLDGKDVKNLGLTCRELKDICQADVFEFIILMPFRQCLQGFASLFKRSPHLASLVHSIVYGELFVGLLESHYNKRREEGLEQGPSVLRAREDLVPRTNITDKDSDNEELALLREIIRLLPNLEKEVYVEGLNDDSLTFNLSKACPPKYFERIFDISSMGPTWSQELTYSEDASASSTFLTALSEEGRRPRKFQGTGFNSTFLTNLHDEGTMMSIPSKLRELMSGLLEFEIIIEKDQIYDLNFRTSFVSVLGAATNLTTLGLRFSARNDPRYNRLEPGESALMELLNSSDIFFPSLRKLTLSHLICREDDLNGVLFRHADTLNDLEMMAVTLVQGKAAYSCAVRVLERFRKLALSTFTIKSYLSNSGAQSLWFGDENEEEGAFWIALRADTASWVTRKTDKIPEILKRVAIIEGNDDFVLPEEKRGEQVLWRILFDIFWDSKFVDNGILHTHYTQTPPAGIDPDEVDQLAAAVETDLGIQDEDAN